MSPRLRRPFTLVLVALVWLAPGAAAQAVGTVTATVRVVGGGKTSTRNLDFGTIASTQTVTVAPTAAAAGRFTIEGTPGSVVTFTFTDLPANFGPPSLVLSDWRGIHGRNNPASGTNFTPAEGASIDFILTTSGRHFVWLGATLTATNAPGGNRLVPVVVSVVFQ